MIRALGYVRVSSQDQAREGLSLATQKEKIEAYCNLNDFDLQGIFEDAGISGKNLTGRPGIQKVLKMANKKEVDAVICFKLDRMFRSTMDALETTQRFNKLGISFHSINERIDTESATGEFFFTLLAAIGQMERRMAGERIKVVMEHKKQNGEKLGGKIPYGFNVDDGKLIENKAERKVINKILKLNKAGLNYSMIARKLNASKIVAKNGGKWFPQTIKNVILSDKQNLKKRIEGLNRAALREVDND